MRKLQCELCPNPKPKFRTLQLICEHGDKLHNGNVVATLTHTSGEGREVPGEKLADEKPPQDLSDAPDSSEQDQAHQGTQTGNLNSGWSKKC